MPCGRHLQEMREIKAAGCDQGVALALEQALGLQDFVALIFIIFA